ncbi:MAG: DUF4032 domain-containing protein [Micrococcales bacterium]|nr:DUF4032 domain-containing protein [Micrococcales bacterium]
MQHPQSLRITAASPDPALLDLPWHVPLERWPEELLAALPRGISRHIVRFARLSGRVIAIKEIRENLAYHEYDMLRQLDVPSVLPVGIIAGRSSPDGEPLEAALITEHLPFSLPYRALFSQGLRPDTATRLIDALAVLMVRLHLEGFFWGDVSLSNTLFRRDAGAFSAYLVDAETGDLHERLSDGQRAYDLDIARINIIGELMDLQAGELLDPDADVTRIGDALVERYGELWRALTEVESFSFAERWRVQARIDRLNDLGFDVDELAMTTEADGTTVHIQPKVVDAGHHSRRLMRLTGLDVQENQARRLLNDLDEYRAATGRQHEDESFVALDWLNEAFEPAVRAVPRNLRGQLEAAEIYHELLEHRWFMSQAQHRDVPMPEVADDYVRNILPSRPDEHAVLGVQPGEPRDDTGVLPAVIDD